MPPVALGVEIAQLQLLRQSQLDASGAVGDPAGDELNAAQRTLVVEQNAVRAMHAEAFAIVDGHPVPVQLGDGIGAARMKGSALGLLRLLDQPVHFRRTRLVESRLGTAEANCLEHVADPEAGHQTGQKRLIPGGFDETLSAEVVNLVGGDVAENADQRGQIGQIAVDELYVIENAEPAEAFADDV